MLWLPINRTSDISLTQQIYFNLRQRILHGELAAEQRLPATRELALHLGVSRNIILEVYDQLKAEGYLEGRLGAGTYVAQGARWELSVAQPIRDRPPSSTSTATDFIDFRSGVPALKRFPRKRWSQLSKQIHAELPASGFGYGPPAGCAELRSTLSRYLLRTRGVNCHSDQIVITSGATQAFSLLTKLLICRGDVVAIEDPSSPELQQIFFAADASLASIPVDEQGLQTRQLPTAKPPRLILVTPSHQFPLGSVLTIQRRIELLQFAKATDCYIVEDDYDSEFRYGGEPLSSLQGLAPEQVIYVGTFSKILSPASA